MKRTFYQLSFGNICLHILGIGMCAGCLVLSTNLTVIIIMCIMEFTWSDFPRIIAGLLFLPVFVFPVPALIWGFIDRGHNKLIYKEHHFYITGNLARDDGAEQCKDEIDVRNIKAIKLLLSHKNSKKQGYFDFLEFFEFTLLDGSRKCVLISYFSRIQRKKILTIINNETGSDFSYKNLPQANYLMTRKRKKKKKSS